MQLLNYKNQTEFDRETRKNEFTVDTMQLNQVYQDKARQELQTYQENNRNIQTDIQEIN